jgi:hypothetical protein
VVCSSSSIPQFIVPWWNRYLGITNEGWYQFFGKQILQRLVPYRDFYRFVPPGQPLLMPVDFNPSKEQVHENKGPNVIFSSCTAFCCRFIARVHTSP